MDSPHGWAGAEPAPAKISTTAMKPPMKITATQKPILIQAINFAAKFKPLPPTVLGDAEMARSAFMAKTSATTAKMIGQTAHETKDKMKATMASAEVDFDGAGMATVA